MKITNLIAEKLRTSIKNTGCASLVVSGGSSPLKIFNALSNINLEWSNVKITLVDDRLVDAKNTNSNQNLIHKHLLKNKAKNSVFFPLTKKLLSENFFKIPFDICLLGMGEDGHFASLFPNMINDFDAFSLKAKHKIIKTSPNGDPLLPRITMNLSLILNSNIIILLVKGEKKEAVLKKALNEKKYPIHYLLKNRKENLFIEIINS
jgi:6-phosphogluconolactonase